MAERTQVLAHAAHATRRAISVRASTAPIRGSVLFSDYSGNTLILGEALGELAVQLRATHGADARAVLDAMVDAAFEATDPRGRS